MNNTQKTAFRYAIRKVRQFVNRNKLSENPKEPFIIRAFLSYHKINFNGGKNDLKKFLAKLYIEKHPALNFAYKKRKKTEKVKQVSFYDTLEWQRLRVMTLKCYGVRCMKCNITKVEMHVDHIRPISKHPHLKLCFGNLQVLCKKCNQEKSNKNEIDYRPFVKENFLYGI
jgi:5-methylcytosine-specific restriction endonuclease McrA